MATTYVILREDRVPRQDADAASYTVVAESVLAQSAEQARRRYADTLSDTELEAGVHLFAVPARNWAGETYKAETKRRVVKA